MSELPPDLVEAEKRINAWKIADQLKKLIGKFYVAYAGVGPPTSLKRIFLDANDEIIVDEYHLQRGEWGQTTEFKWTTRVITKPEGFFYGGVHFSEIEGKAWHECFKRMINIDAIKPADMKLMVNQEKKK